VQNANLPKVCILFLAPFFLAPKALKLTGGSFPNFAIFECLI
jgi:hypothetical protein